MADEIEPVLPIAEPTEPVFLAKADGVGEFPKVEEILTKLVCPKCLGVMRLDNRQVVTAETTTLKWRCPTCGLKTETVTADAEVK